MQKDVKIFNIAEVMLELKENGNKLFKAVNEDEFSNLKRYTMVDDEICSIEKIRGELNIEPARITSDQILGKLKFVEVVFYCDLIKANEKYFFINQNLEIDCNTFTEKTIRNRNMFRSFSEAKFYLVKLEELFRVFYK